jgi:hypothetical protein
MSVGMSKMPLKTIFMSPKKDFKHQSQCISFLREHVCHTSDYWCNSNFLAALYETLTTTSGLLLELHVVWNAIPSLNRLVWMCA